MERLSRDQGHVLTRRQLYRAGYTRWEIRANVDARRWRRIGRLTVCTYTGPLSEESLMWAAVMEAGPRAVIDGGWSLLAAGLKNYRLAGRRVSVPRGVACYPVPGVVVRQTRRWRPDDVGSVTPPRTRVEVAAVREALWARSNRQAALVLAMVVQQGMTTPQRLGEEMLKVRRHKRRVFINAVILDLVGGVRSLGELDVIRECRRRGIPAPTLQRVRRGANGRYYLDLYWEQWNLVVEVDGIHHTWAGQVIGDALRQNDLVLQGDQVLRVPLLGLRVDPDAFFAQIEQAIARASGSQRHTG